MTTDSKAAPSDAGKRDTAIELVSFYRKAVVEALGGGAEEVATMHAEQRRLVNALAAPGAAIAAREQGDAPGGLTSQQVMDRFSYLEGLVGEGTYRQIVKTVMEIQRAALAKGTK